MSSTKQARPDEALRRLMTQRVGQQSRSKLPPKNSEAFARQLLQQALEGDTKTQKMILELLEYSSEPQDEERAARQRESTEIILKVVDGVETGV